MMKKPKLPNQVLVGNIRYNIEPLPFEVVNQGINGQCTNVFNHTIRIDNDLVGEEAIDTMFHEIFHAMDDVYNIKLTHRQIYRLSETMTHLIRHNPHIFYWMEKIEDYSETLMEETV